MLADGRTVPSGEVLRTEVCIVGAGPAGMTAAMELDAAGVDVLLLERGDDQLNGGLSELDTAVNIGLPYSPRLSRASGVGGSLHKWNERTSEGDGFGRMKELEAIDFERREWIPNSGWPFGKEHLDPYYARARALFAPAESWYGREEVLFTELDHNSLIATGGPIRTVVFPIVNPGTFLDRSRRYLERADRILLLTNVVVTDIRTDHLPSSVSSLRVAAVKGPSFTVEAEIYILATGGIETPRLLLASRSRQHDGLGNAHDLVGRYFMEHPHYSSGLLAPHDDDIFGHQEAYAVHGTGQEFMQKKYALSEEVQRREGLGNCVFLYEPTAMTPKMYSVRMGERGIRGLRAITDLRSQVRGEPTSDGSLGLIRRAACGLPQVARYTAQRLAAQSGRQLGLERYTEPILLLVRAMSEQVPNPSSRVELAEECDDLGVPIARLDWRLHEQDLRTIRGSQAVLGQALHNIGHKRVESLVDHRASTPPGLTGGNHHMGTTRIHDSPRLGVVDRSCRVHGVNNLFVAGSATFPTGGYANPTLTLLALVLRLTDHVVKQLGRSRTIREGLS